MADEHRKRQQIPQLSRSQIKSFFQNIEYLEGTAQKIEDTLAPLNAREREFIQHWVRAINRSNDEVARLFAQRAPEALRLMDFDGVEAWLLKALEAFDQRGLGWAVDILNQPAQFAETRARRTNALPLGEVTALLQRLVTGLGGRELRLDSHETPYTDTETLYLPAELETGDRADNARLYKALAVHHWAQTWYGSWRPAVLAALRALPETALPAFAAAERLRLDACIARDLPGAYRDMRQLGQLFDQTTALPPAWQNAAMALADALATAADSCRWAARLAGESPPAPACYHGGFYPQRVRAVLDTRLARERRQLSLVLGKLQQEMEKNTAGEAGTQPRTRKPTEGFALSNLPMPSTGAGISLQLRYQERPVAMPEGMNELLNSIVQDLGEVPEEYFRPGGAKPYDAQFDGGAGSGGGGTVRTTTTDGLLRYREWDYTRQRFRPAYCILHEHTVAPGDDDFVPQTLQKYRGLLKSIRRSFEAMLGDTRLQRRQPNGDDIDLDALVEAHADARNGEEMREAVYTRLDTKERSIAVMFMVDMSGSTKGWVNEAEREALVLLSEALETIGDRYAIYGFSGRTHQRVDLYHIKRFDEPYDTRVRGRISGIRPQSYTRMGAPIRHLGGLLGREPARNKLLVTLSDGKPEDYCSYYGRYGIEDTRHALLELRRDSIHPFCITIDKEGGDYLPYMYGVANYTCIDAVQKLPLKVADIYRKLTTRN